MAVIPKDTLQARIAVASFSAGVLIAAVCIFFIDPIGEIHSTAISIVSEFLILAGTLLGVKTAFDHKLMTFRGEVMDEIDRRHDELKNKDNE